MLKAAFWSPAEPTWVFEVCAAPRFKGHFAGGGRLPTRVPSVIAWNRPTTRPARFSTSGRAQNASCSFFLEKFFVLVFRGSQGRSPRRVQEGLLPPIHPIHPRIPPRSLHYIFIRAAMVAASCFSNRSVPLRVMS
jgi:hypothetical protein